MFVHALTVRAVIAIAPSAFDFSYDDLFEFCGCRVHCRDLHGPNVDSLYYGGIRFLFHFFNDLVVCWCVSERDLERSWTKA